MNPEQNIIEIRENPHENYTDFYMHSDKGQLTSSIDLNTLEYEIIDYIIYNAYRRQGYGKELFKFGVDHAKSIGAQAIIGVNIVSRESINVIASVIGEDKVTIEKLGDYTPQGKDDNSVNRTKASFRYDTRAL